MDSFGERLRQAQAAAGVTGEQLAGLLGVRQATVSAWVNDESRPSGDHMVRLPGLLKTDGHWLLTGERRAVVVDPNARQKLAEIRAILDRPEDGAGLPADPSIDAVSVTEAAEQSRTDLPGTNDTDGGRKNRKAGGHGGTERR